MLLYELLIIIFAKCCLIKMLKSCNYFENCIDFLYFPNVKKLSEWNVIVFISICSLIGN